MEPLYKVDCVYYIAVLTERQMEAYGLDPSDYFACDQKELVAERAKQLTAADGIQRLDAAPSYVEKRGRTQPSTISAPPLPSNADYYFGAL